MKFCTMSSASDARMPRTSMWSLKLSLRDEMSTDTTVRAVTGRIASRYSLFETTVSRLLSTVVRICPKATCARLPFTDCTTPTISCPAMRTFDPATTSRGFSGSGAAVSAAFAPCRALRSSRRCRRRSMRSISRATAASFSDESACSTVSRKSSSSLRASRVNSFSACASRIVRIVFSICRLASAISCCASCLAFFSISCRSARIFASCSA